MLQEFKQSSCAANRDAVAPQICCWSLSLGVVSKPKEVGPGFSRRDKFLPIKYERLPC